MSAVRPAFSSSSRSMRSRNERKRSAAMPPDFFMDAPRKRSADNIGGLCGPQPWRHRYCLACSDRLLCGLGGRTSEPCCRWASHMKQSTKQSAGPPPAPSSGSDGRAAFGALIGQVARRWRALVDARLKAFGLTEATWRPLLHLSKFPAPPRQTDLAESLSIEGPSLVRLLDTLERDGYILRCADSDRRTKTIRLTPRGETLQRKIAAVVADTRDQVLAGVA